MSSVPQSRNLKRTFADDLMDSQYRIRDENAALKKEITKLKRELNATNDAVNTWMNEAQETEADYIEVEERMDNQYTKHVNDLLEKNKKIAEKNAIINNLMATIGTERRKTKAAKAAQQSPEWYTKHMERTYHKYFQVLDDAGVHPMSDFAKKETVDLQKEYSNHISSKDMDDLNHRAENFACFTAESINNLFPGFY
ncbi:hypothetical protein EXVG_00131 [Emiliania huxleyi virus 202]|nr:hypothetical protein EXVG_00131 [Emiliania huxleyi virus 202]AHA54055.1 hypothetical protein EhV18_00004 [Emiliania huxleyi virus 18]AHA55105.1 hypothetical protein EhV156_00004 [Emiliania huxleyi virus 156]